MFMFYACLHAKTCAAAKGRDIGQLHGLSAFIFLTLLQSVLLYSILSKYDKQPEWLFLF
jgi:hypothetical protein